MANVLGSVTETQTGFEGGLEILSLSAVIRIKKNAEKAGEGQPDDRMFSGEASAKTPAHIASQGERLGARIRLHHPRRPPDRLRKIHASFAPVTGKKGRRFILCPPPPRG